MSWILSVYFFCLIIYRIHSIYLPFHTDHLVLDSAQDQLLSQEDSKPNADEADPDANNVCLTTGCIKAALDILASLNETVDPCDDFYQFSCGGWINKHEIPKDKAEVTLITYMQDDLALKLKNLLEEESVESEPDFIRMTKRFYSSCMDLDKIEAAGSEPLEKALRFLGGWPIVEGDNWDGSNFDWMDTLFNFRKLGHDYNILISFGVGPDMRNNSANILYLGAAELGISERSYMIKGLKDPVTAAYFQLMLKSAEKLGANKTRAETELMDALNFEISLAKFTLPKQRAQNHSLQYKEYTVEKLQEFIPHIDWLKYFNGLLNDPVFLNDTLLIDDFEFVVKFSELVQNTDKRIIANYMIWRSVLETMPLLSTEWRTLEKEHTISTSIIGTGRWGVCLEAVSTFMFAALSSYYVRHYFNEESRETALEMANDIHKEFLDILDNIDWMDESTKMNAIEKANAIKLYIGYPEELLNDTIILKVFENITIDDNYYDNILRLGKWSTDFVSSRFRKPNRKGDWLEQSEKVIQPNAFYEVTSNNIVFPAAFLQKVYFNKDRPNYMNYGALGFILGHEITHGFDDTGRQFDKDGNNINWWDPTTDELYNEKVGCIIKQYSNYTIESGLHVNGVLTLGENIADLGGIKESYLAYQTWVKEHGKEPQLPGLNYTPNQLFFISLATAWCSNIKLESLEYELSYEEHSPNQFRIIGTMSNFPEFSKEFQCKLGSPMNPRNKCEVW